MRTWDEERDERCNAWQGEDEEEQTRGGRDKVVKRTLSKAHLAVCWFVLAVVLLFDGSAPENA